MTIRPRLDVELPDGSTGFVDQSATKAWHQESPAHVVGETHDAVVLGPDRTPVRLSIRDVDIENAQRLDDGADPESQTQART